MKPLLLLLAACHSDPTPKTPATGTDDTAGGGTTDSGTTSAATCRDQPAVALGADTCVSEAPCTWEGDQSYAYLGYVLAAGDITGDGVPDLLTGAPTWDRSPNEGGQVADGGRAVVYSGATILAGGDALVGAFEGELDGDYVGTTVLIAGDLDGDGVDDWLTGGRGAEGPGGEAEAGAAYLILGGSPPSDGTYGAAAVFTGDRAYSRVGTALGAPGDVDGDGLADLLLSGELRNDDVDTPDESYTSGRVGLFYGHAGTWAPSTPLAEADAVWEGQGTMDATGLAMTGGDLDGDGYADVVIASPYGAGLKGRVSVIQGGPGTISGAQDLTAAAVQIDGAAAYDAFGWSLSVGELTGDGVADLAVGAPLSDLAWPNGGAVYVHQGGPDFFAGPSTAIGSITGEFDDHQLGTGLLAGQDLDGDGTGDLVLGAVSTWKGVLTKSGRIYIHPGGSWALETPAADLPVKISGAGVKDYLGRATAATDLDGDGHPELLLGSGYTNHGEGYDMGSIYLFWGQ